MAYSHSLSSENMRLQWLWASPCMMAFHRPEIQSQILDSCCRYPIRGYKKNGFQAPEPSIITGILAPSGEVILILIPNCYAGGPKENPHTQQQMERRVSLQHYYPVFN